MQNTAQQTPGPAEEILFSSDDHHAKAEIAPVSPERRIIGVQRVNVQGNMIARIAGSFAYVREDESIGTLSNELLHEEDIQVLGVVDATGRALGIVDRKSLFELLGRPHCRDVFGNRTVNRISRRVRSFPWDENIFTVAEILHDELQSAESVQYYLLTDHEEKFRGVFSTRDILVYLSSITQKDINLATRLQRSIVKDEEHVKADTFELVSRTEMAKGVGGDFYYLRKYRDNHWAICIGDVSGKGISASLVTAIMGGMFSIYDFRLGLPAIIERINDYVFNSFEMEKFITGVFLDLDERSGVCQVADMGHSLLFLRRNNRVLQVKAGQDNLPLGVNPHLVPQIKSLKLQPGDLLFACTDGVTDQSDPSGKPYSLRRLAAFLHKHIKSSPVEINAALMDDIRAFQGRMPQGDDITYLILQYNGPKN